MLPKTTYSLVSECPCRSNLPEVWFLRVKIEIFECDLEGNVHPLKAWKEMRVPHQSSTSLPSFHQPDIQTSDILDLKIGPRSLCALHRQNQVEELSQNKISCKLSLKCLYTNFLSLPNKLREIKQLAYDKSPCVMAFTETWLTSEYRDSELAIPGFPLIRADSTHGRAGGVVIYLLDDLSLPLFYFHLTSQPMADTLWMRLLLRHSDALLIGLLYRSPSSDLQRDNNLLISIRDFIHSHNFSHLPLLGNFNALDVLWDQGISTGGFSSRLL